jgi:aspartate 1-decarboxylase
MLITMLRAKLHRLTVTQADLNYIGSITLDPDLLDAAGLFEGEKVQIVNINNGERFETYTILGRTWKWPSRTEWSCCAQGASG